MKKLLTIFFVFVSLISFGQAKHKGKFGVYSFEDSVYFKVVPSLYSAGIVHLGIDTAVGSPTFGKLVRKTASGSTPTLQQVLTAGSTLTTSNTIATGANQLTISGGLGSNPILVVSNSTSSGFGIQADAINATAVNGAASGSGDGIAGSSSTGRGMAAISTSGVGAAIYVNPSSTNTIIPVLEVQRLSSGTAATGEGGSIDFYNETDGGTARKTNQIVSVLRNGTDANRQAQLVFTGLGNASLAIDTLATMGDFVTLTESTATLFTSTLIASSKIAGGTILVTVEANDLTNFQARTLRFIWSAVNKAGTLTITISTPEEVVALSSGTLTCTITAVDGGSGVLQFKANAVSSLTQSTLRCSYQTFKNF